MYSIVSTAQSLFVHFSILATFLGLPQDLMYTPSNWNSMTHGNITVVIVLFLFRCPSIFTLLATHSNSLSTGRHGLWVSAGHAIIMAYRDQKTSSIRSQIKLSAVFPAHVCLYCRSFIPCAPSWLQKKKTVIHMLSQPAQMRLVKIFYSSVFRIICSLQTDFALSSVVQ